MLYRCYTPRVGGVWQPQVHRSCGHNMVAGLCLRTMAPVPDPTDGGVELFRASARLITRAVGSRVLPFDRWEFNQVAASYTEKRLRVRYEQAALSLVTDGLCTPRDAFVKAFVKGELLSNYKVHKPRVIMARSPRYNLELASYLKPLEHEVYGAFRGFGKCFTRTRLIGKGLNSEQRGELIRRKLTSRPDLVCFEVDGRSFESHVRDWQLDSEHRFYGALHPDPRLRQLLRWQKKFAGAGAGGVKFKLSGVRASGDFNTGLGNTFIMCCLVLGVARALGTGFDFLADGDNAVVFVRSCDLALWQLRMPELFIEMGHEAEVGPATSELPGVVFGQSKPLLVGGIWRMVRDPFKVLSHTCCDFKHYNEMRGGMRVLKSVAYCEAVLGSGVPVLQAFAHRLLELTSHVSFSKAVLDNYEYKRILARGIRWADARKREITSEARTMFWISWGIPPEKQVAIEASFSSASLPSDWSDVPIEEEIPDGRDYWTLPALAALRDNREWR